MQSVAATICADQGTRHAGWAITIRGISRVAQIQILQNCQSATGTARKRALRPYSKIEGKEVRLEQKLYKIGSAMYTGFGWEAIVKSSMQMLNH